jgi:hypothetical protein
MEYHLCYGELWRLIPSFFIFPLRVVRFKLNPAAAPFGLPKTHLVWANVFENV